MTHKTVWFRLRDSYWFVPAIYSILSIVTVSLTTLLDHTVVVKLQNVIPDYILTNHDIAKSLYSSLITAILTMTTISFASIMVVLTTTSSQFSPRTLQDFMIDNVTQHVLGIFSFSFIFALINLLLLVEDKDSQAVSPTLMVVFTIISLSAFILFIHHSTRWVQVNYLIGNIRNEASRVIKEHFSKKRASINYEWNEPEIEKLKQNEPTTIYADTSGYVQQIQYESLIQWASENKIVLKSHFQVGNYLQSGMPILQYWRDDSGHKVDISGYRDYILIGVERTGLYDIEFSIQKLVEIALRAISPAINDPHTAINCVNRIGSLLTDIGEYYFPMKYFADKNDELRLIMEHKTFKEYLYKSFYQIRHYGKEDISVMSSILDSLNRTAIVSSDEIKDVIWEFGKYIMAAIDTKELDILDYDYIHYTAEKLADTCQESLNF